MNKKAMQLSMNFLVIIIISLIIFVSSAYMLTNIFNKSNTLTSSQLNKLEDKLNTINCGGSNFCISPSSLELRGKDTGKITVRIINTLTDSDSKTFTINVKLKSAYEGRTKINTANNNPTPSITFLNDPITLEKNQEKQRVILITIPPKQPSGIYRYEIKSTYTENNNNKEFSYKTLTINVP